MRTGLGVAVAIAAAGALQCNAQPLARDVLVLARVKQHVAERLKHLPEYTCVETIRRYTRRVGAAEPLLRDTVRLEVAHAGGRELFAWPGATQFGPDHPAALARDGLSSSGDFVQRLSLVFENPSTSFRYGGEADINGRRAFRYDFAVPLFSSSWKVQVEGAAVRIAAKGTFWADPETYAPVRLELHGSDVPPGLPMREISAAVDYADASEAVGWLPASADVRLVTSTTEHRNVTEFSSCRRYQTESAISFGDPASGERVTAQRPPGSRQDPLRLMVAPIPAGVLLRVQLTTALDSETSAVGDEITCRLGQEVKAGDRVLPPGTAIKGRIRMLQRYDTPRSFYAVALEFNSVETDTAVARTAVKLIRTDAYPGLSRKVEVSQERHQSTSGDPFHSRTLILQDTEIRSMALPDEPGLITFYVEGERFRLPPRFGLTLKTEAAR